MKRTCVYIDGFNLYYRCLKDTPYKWLDLYRMAELLLPADRHEITKVKFFTARIDARNNDPDAPRRQDVYLRALSAYRPQVEIVFGHFLSHAAMRPYAPPATGWAKVTLTEEKGTDVNLAVHLLNDAWLDSYDCAVVVSNDSDLAEAMRLAKERNKLIGWMVTGKQHPSAGSGENSPLSETDPRDSSLRVAVANPYSRHCHYKAVRLVNRRLPEGALIIGGGPPGRGAGAVCGPSRRGGIPPCSF